MRPLRPLAATADLAIAVASLAAAPAPGGTLFDCSGARAVPERLWPPDHRLVPVSVANGPRIGSDHYPLEVVLRASPGPEPAGGFRTAAAPPTSRR